MNNYSNLLPILESVQVIFDLYKQYGASDYIGEEISQLEHALQCAEQAELEYPNKNAYIIGALFHDIGHLISLDNGRTISFTFDNISMEGLGLAQHEHIGANFLEYMGFPEEVCNLGRFHVIAKRYLITTNSDYFHNLSEASKKTFIEQGGNLSDLEIETLSKNPHLPIYLKMRSWDDKAKIKDYHYKHDLDYYENMTINYLQSTIR
jgi:predicted HD phosphohydrolase